MNKEKDYDEKVKQIRELFDAIPEMYVPNNDEAQLMDERNRPHITVWLRNLFVFK